VKGRLEDRYSILSYWATPGRDFHPTTPGLLIGLAAILLASCATVEPPRPPEIRTTTVEVRVPVPVPCFTEAERPIRQTPTPINIDTATVDQMAAAIAADDLADELFARAVDALFILCMKRIADGTATIPVGVKP
jgi:hypothetical protein